ncbi:hypothetical protein KK001_20730, partial [Enterobacter roggenkampii]|nr:hypothetical protein [Enterobacter roggenkampii]
MKNKRAWAFKTISKKELVYRGNDGYDDNPFELYSYDNLVANHKQVESGDIVVIYNRKHVIGVAVITSLIKEDSQKEINQCPINNCKAEKIRTRTREGANKQVISSQADSLIKISRIWADFFPANT